MVKISLHVLIKISLSISNILPAKPYICHIWWKEVCGFHNILVNRNNASVNFASPKFALQGKFWLESLVEFLTMFLWQSVFSWPNLMENARQISPHKNFHWMLSTQNQRLGTVVCGVTSRVYFTEWSQRIYIWYSEISVCASI